MNAKIQEILHKHAKSDGKCPFNFQTIACPDMIRTDLPSLFFSDSSLCYTFDGRTIWLAGMSSTIMSLPDCTRNLACIVDNHIHHLFLLSTKNKLEVCRCSSDRISDRNVLTRNVLAMKVCNNILYFVFKKNATLYTNIAFYDGTKWIGKRIMPELTGESVSLFCFHDSIFAIVDGTLYDQNAQPILKGVDFMHVYNSMLIVGHEIDQTDQTTNTDQISDQNNETIKYELAIKVLEYKGILPEVHHRVSTTLELAKPYKIQADKDIILIKTGNKIVFMQIEASKLKIINGYENNTEIYEVGMIRHEERIEVMQLAGKEVKKEIGEALTEFKAIKDEIENEIKSDEITSDSDLYVNNKIRKSNILEEVKEELAKASEQTNKISDATDQIKNIISNAMLSKIKNEKKKINTKNDETDLQHALKSAFSSVFVKNEVFIKELIAKVLVPPIEAAMNEMRIQVVGEIKRVMAGIKQNGENDKLVAFKRLVSNGQGREVIKELMKIKDEEIEAYLMHVGCEMYEEIDAELLAGLGIRLCEILKKEPNDACQRSLMDVLAAIEIKTISVENTQALSLALRYCSDSSKLNELYPGFGYVIELTLRKLKKHSRRMALKL